MYTAARSCSLVLARELHSTDEHAVRTPRAARARVCMRVSVRVSTNLKSVGGVEHSRVRIARRTHVHHTYTFEARHELCNY